MNTSTSITLIFGPLALLNIFFYTSVQGEVWRLMTAQVDDHTYDNQVSLERKDDGKKWYIHAIPPNSMTDLPEVVHGPFQVRGFGPYSMVMIGIWLNTDAYVNVTFHNPPLATDFYHVLNAHHSRSFLNEFKIKQLMYYSSDGRQLIKFKGGAPKALDVFVLNTSTGHDSNERRYVVHYAGGDQEPILIFHLSEVQMSADGDGDGDGDGDYITLSIRPLNSTLAHKFRVEFEQASSVERVLRTYTAVRSLRRSNDTKYLEASSNNTYPTANR